MTHTYRSRCEIQVGRLQLFESAYNQDNFLFCLALPPTVNH